MATPEGKVKGWLDKMFKAEGVCYFSPQAGPYGSSGVEDRIAIVCGLYLGVEVKADKSKKMTAKQELRKKEVQKAGGFHFLVYDKETIEQVRQFIQYVRSSYPGSEDIGTSYGQSGAGTVCHSQGTLSKTGVGISTPSVRRNDSPEELGLQHPITYEPLLQMAWAVQTDGPPTDHGCLPHHTQEMYCP